MKNNEELITIDKNGWRHCFNTLALAVNRNAKDKGFWEKDRNDGEMLCLIHSEVSEVLEALRKNNPPSEKIPDYSTAEEELADVVIRLMDLAHSREWDVAGAVLAKMDYNKNRPYKHGKKF